MPTNLDALFANKIACIVEDVFLSPEQINIFLAKLTAMPDWYEPKIPKKLQHLFPIKDFPKHLFYTQYGFYEDGVDEAAYLKISQDYAETWKRLTTACGFDPFVLLVDYFKKKYQANLQPAHKNQQNYFTLVVRDLAKEVLPHADFGPYDGKEWAINQVEQQLAWNIYLTAPQQGGETTIYDYVWDENTPIDENSYGIQQFNQPVKHRFKVTPGKLVLFNCRNFHAISESSAPRIAIGGLIGKTKDQQLIAWA